MKTFKKTAHLLQDFYQSIDWKEILKRDIVGYFNVPPKDFKSLFSLSILKRLYNYTFLDLQNILKSDERAQRFAHLDVHNEAAFDLMWKKFYDFEDKACESDIKSDFEADIFYVIHKYAAENLSAEYIANYRQFKDFVNNFNDGPDPIITSTNVKHYFQSTAD